MNFQLESNRNYSGVINAIQRIVIQGARASILHFPRISPQKCRPADGDRDKRESSTALDDGIKLSGYDGNFST